MIVIFKKQREFIRELKSDFYEATIEDHDRVVYYFNSLLVIIIFLFFEILAMILGLLNLNVLSIIILLSAFIYFFIAVASTKVLKLTEGISSKLLFYLFGRYGKVINSKDWKNIKKHTNNKQYKCLTTKKSIGKSYYCSWFIANFLQNAQIMYCSIQVCNETTGHAVIIKDNCIYDTSDRIHYDYDDYMELKQAVVYRTFSENEYRKETFLNDIQEDFVDWCLENNVYCNPE